MTYKLYIRELASAISITCLLFASGCKKPVPTIQFATAPQTVEAGKCSSEVRLKNINANSNNTATQAELPVTVTGAKIFADAECTDEVSEIPMEPGATEVGFYFSSTIAGTISLTARQGTGKAAMQKQKILPASPAALAFSSSPKKAIVNVVISPAIKVQIQDVYGNQIDNATVRVKIDLQSDNNKGATLSGTKEVETTTGVATFNNLSIDSVGNDYTLVASSKGLKSAVSQVFSVEERESNIRELPSPLYGVTLDEVERLSDIVMSLSSLPRMPTARIVFDEFVPASEYSAAVKAIRPVAYIMGEILDSEYVAKYTIDNYSLRTTEYLDAFGDQVDLWEIGNEVNGEWLGKTPDVVAKISNAYSLVKSRGYRTELTLYYNEGCWENRNNEMFTWAEKNIPADMKQGLDYVLVSYYEDDCNGLKPNWPVVFAKLAAMFPNSKIGIGEMGTERAAAKADFINRYYSMRIDEPNYVGGYFWWYFIQDMVPMTKPLWTTISNAMKQY